MMPERSTRTEPPRLLRRRRRWPPEPPPGRCTGHATPEAMRQAIRDVLGEAEVRTGKVTLDIPPLVENGNAVPLTVSVESPMTEADHVKAIHVFNEKNPQPHVISHPLGPRAGKAEVATRIKLADSQTGRRDRRNERRLVLERQRRCDRHARGLCRGLQRDGARAHGQRARPRPGAAR